MRLYLTRVQQHARLTDLSIFVGTPIESVQVVLLPLPLPDAAACPDDDLDHPELHRIRLFASTFPDERWTKAKLVDSVDGEKRSGNDKNWGWTLFSASIEVPQDVKKRAEDGESKVALVAYASEFLGFPFLSSLPPFHY